MLYNPKWEGEWSLNALIAFGETKPPHERYYYTQPKYCAVAQFRAAKGYYPISLTSDEIPQPFRDILNPLHNPRYTWGGIVERARYAAARATSFA